MLTIVAILLATWVLINWTPVQNRLVGYATKKLSKSLKNEINIGSVDFSLFNKFLLKDVLIRDKKQDTLLAAGTLTLRVSDWFFLKEDVTLHYIGLENGVVYLKRSDSIWNYQFMVDAFSTPKKSTKESTLKIALEKLEVNNFRFLQNDEWRGQDMNLALSSMVLYAKDINLKKKIVAIKEVEIIKPIFGIKQYLGKRPKRLKPKTNLSAPWNPDNWQFLVGDIDITKGKFSSDIKTKRAVYDYFDTDHLMFNNLDAHVQNMQFKQDTVSALVHLKADERSGFSIKSLDAIWKMHPKEMSFTDLRIITPYSNIGNSFSMGYASFNDDMPYFVSRVNLKGVFNNSKIDVKDLAFFAPTIKDLPLTIVLDGIAEGTLSNLQSKNLRIKNGKGTMLSGDFSMKGLPDLGQFEYAMQGANLITIPEDVFILSPMLKTLKAIDLKKLEKSTFYGNIKGNTKDIAIKGELKTKIGNIKTDLFINNIADKSITVDATGSLLKFNAGALIGLKELGSTSGIFSVKTTRANNIEFDTDLSAVQFNGYVYHHLKAKGDFKNQQLDAKIDVQDEHLDGRFIAKINLKNPLPQIIVDAQVLTSNLKELKFISLPIEFSGRTHAELEGDNIDNIKGKINFEDLVLIREDQAYVMDSLVVFSDKKGTYRTLIMEGSDIDLNMQGNFDFGLLRNTFNQYFSKYYPLYFDKVVPLKKDQDIAFNITLKKTNSFFKLLDAGITGFNNSKIVGGINTNNKLFYITAEIPKFSYNKLSVYDYFIKAEGNIDSLIVKTRASSIVFNDSLSFPNNEITIRSSRNLSRVDVHTFSEQSMYGANLSAYVSNLYDGIRINFNPSTLVFNEKTWNIEKDGEVLISRAKLNANNFKLSNGDQTISIIALPPEANSPQNIILTLTKVNLGELLPFVLKEPRIQGITTGDLTIEDPFDKLKLYLNAQTDKTRFEEDSIGITTINAFWDKEEKRASYFLESNNPEYLFGVKGKLNLADNAKDQIDTDIDVKNVKLSILEKYLDVVFSDLEGTANGKLRLHGNFEEPDLTGEVKVSKGKLTIAYTQCTYQLEDPTIEFKPDQINFGTIKLKDIYGNAATLKGSLDHRFFRKFKYNITASSNKLLALNTRKENNNLFHGKAIAKFNFSLTGPEEDIKMYVSGAPVDSSTINILTSTSSKQSADVDFIVWTTYGQEMKADLKSTAAKLTIDLDLTASPLLKMNVVLDELTGDIISGVGSGNLKIHTGTSENLSLIGKYNIESGNYNFNFQDIFKKPFKLVGGSSYISWTGDPLDAEINIDAVYLAEKVRMSTLFTDPSNSTVSGVSSDVLREISDVEVRCNLSGTLNKPNPTFQIVIPQTSTVRNNSTIESKLKTINRDALEVSKQSTYLIVFKSFAPQAAVVASDLNSELINTTISGVINGILSNSIQNFFSKVLGSSVDVNLNYSRTLNSSGLTGTGSSAGSSQNNFRENVSLQFIKSLVNNKLVISFGSDFNFSSVGGNSFSSNSQSFLFLPDVNVEYKISPDGKFRTSFFYRSSFDNFSTSGKRNRTGGNISFRTEFDRLFGK